MGTPKTRSTLLTGYALDCSASAPPFGITALERPRLRSPSIVRSTCYSARRGELLYGSGRDGQRRRDLSRGHSGITELVKAPHQSRVVFSSRTAPDSGISTRKIAAALQISPTTVQKLAAS
jgi:hypothetical protein